MDWKTIHINWSFYPFPPENDQLSFQKLCEEQLFFLLTQESSVCRTEIPACPGNEWWKYVIAPGYRVLARPGHRKNAGFQIFHTSGNLSIPGIDRQLYDIGLYHRRISWHAAGHGQPIPQWDEAGSALRTWKLRNGTSSCTDCGPGISCDLLCCIQKGERQTFSCPLILILFQTAILAASPAAMPHIMHDTKCIAAVVPPAPYYKLWSCGFNSTLLIIKDASQSCRIPCREKGAALLSFIFQSSDRWHPLQKLA